jgi:hypothetical protein
MNCFDCGQQGRERLAVAMCHHCSAGLCRTHSICVEDPITANEPLFKTVVLPLRARLFFCGFCRAAFEQRGLTNQPQTRPPAAGRACA